MHSIRRPLTARSDAELVAALRAGEGDALGEIDRRYRSFMLSIARPLVAGTGYDAEDAVQDALINAGAALSHGTRTVALRPWLAIVVRNRALDLRRRRRADCALPDDHDAAARHASDAADAVVRREEFLTVIRDVAALPPRQRTAIAMRVFEGASHRDLAARLGSSVPASKALLARARKALAAAA